MLTMMLMLMMMLMTLLTRAPGGWLLCHADTHLLQWQCTSRLSRKPLQSSNDDYDQHIMRITKTSNWSLQYYSSATCFSLSRKPLQSANGDYDQHIMRITKASNWFLQYLSSTTCFSLSRKPLQSGVWVEEFEILPGSLLFYFFITKSFQISLKVIRARNFKKLSQWQLSTFL